MNYPYFNNTKILSVEKLNGEVNTDSLFAEFTKIKDDLQKGEKIFVNLQESEFKKRLITEYDENIPIYFRDDVRFLNGKTTVYLRNIAHKAKIRFHIVSKTYIQLYVNNHNWKPFSPEERYRVE